MIEGSNANVNRATAHKDEVDMSNQMIQADIDRIREDNRKLGVAIATE